MPKLEKAVLPAVTHRSWTDRLFIPLCVALGATLGILVGTHNEMRRQEGRAVAALDAIGRLKAENAALEKSLADMTATAGAIRSYGAYHDCAMQALGIYRIPEVERAFDRFFRTAEMSRRCLAEAAWYETHPIGHKPGDPFRSR